MKGIDSSDYIETRRIQTYVTYLGIVWISFYSSCKTYKNFEISDSFKFDFILKIIRIRLLYFIGIWKTLSYLKKAWFMWNIEAGVKNICVLFVIIYCGKLPWENLLLLYIGDITYLSLSGCFIINTFFVIRKNKI